MKKLFIILGLLIAFNVFSNDLMNNPLSGVDITDDSVTQPSASELREREISVRREAARLRQIERYRNRINILLLRRGSTIEDCEFAMSDYKNIARFGATDEIASLEVAREAVKVKCAVTTNERKTQRLVNCATNFIDQDILESQAHDAIDEVILSCFF